MKEGWEYRKLGEVATYINGFPFKPSDWKEIGKPIIRIQNLTNPHGGFNRCSRNDIPEKYFVVKGDVLISWSATLGVFEWESEDALLNQHIFKVVFDKADIDKHFFKYAVLMSITEMAKHTNGATMKHIRKGDFDNIKIPYPSLSEQQSIVDYLDSAFAKIDAMKANAEKALNEAKALFQASLKEMLEPKEGWEEKKLGDICSDIRYGTSTPSNENGEYKYLRMNNITNDGFLDVSHYKTISLPEKELEKCLVKRGDIIFNRTNSRELVGKSCVFTEDENMVIAGYLIRIRLKEGFEPQFITYSMNLQRSLGLFQHLIVGAVHQANISANNIQKVIINYPPLSEQKSIVATLDSLKSKVDRLQENYDKISQECDALKQAILRQVFE